MRRRDLRIGMAVALRTRHRDRLPTRVMITDLDDAAAGPRRSPGKARAGHAGGQVTWVDEDGRHGSASLRDLLGPWEQHGTRGGCLRDGGSAAGAARGSAVVPGGARGVRRLRQLRRRCAPHRGAGAKRSPPTRPRHPGSSRLRRLCGPSSGTRGPGTPTGPKTKRPRERPRRVLRSANGVAGAGRGFGSTPRL